MKKDNLKKILKIISILLIVFLVLPIGSIAILYNVNRDFKAEANRYLRIIPGPIGNYFNKFPTSRESNDKLLYIADYYTAINEDSSADKLFIIKKDDKNLYHEIIQAMNKISPEKTENIIKKVRNIELRKNLLVSVYDEIDSEKQDALKEDIENIEGKELLIAKNIVIEYYNNENHKRLKGIFENISIPRTVDLLYYLNEEAYDFIINTMEKDRYMKVNTMLTEKKAENDKLLRQSEIYEVNKVSDTVMDIGNDDNYNMNQLAVIYLNLTADKAASILSEVDDKEFKAELFKEMRNIELLNEELDSKTVKLASEIESIKKKKTKTEDLAKVYEKMDDESLSNLVENMFDEDEELLIEILGKMKEKKVAQVLNFLDTELANKISKKLSSK